MRRFLAISVIAGVFLAGGPAVSAQAACPDESMRSLNADRARLEAALICLITEARSIYVPGAATVRVEPTLSQAVQWHTDDIVARKFSGHNAPAPAPHGTTPQDRAVNAGWPRDWGTDENLIGGTLTPFRTVEFWLNSDYLHCGTLLTKEYDRVGLGFSDPRAYGFLFAGPSRVLSTYTRGDSQCPKTTGLNRAPTLPEWTIEDEVRALDPDNPIWNAGQPGSAAPGAGTVTTPPAVAPTIDTLAQLPSKKPAAVNPGLRVLGVVPVFTTRRTGRGLKLKLQCSAAACNGTARLLNRGKQVAKVRFTAAKGATKTVKITVSRATETALQRARQRKLTFEVAVGRGKITGTVVI